MEEKMELKKIDGWVIFVDKDGNFAAYNDDEEPIHTDTLAEIEQEIERLRKASAKRLPYWEANGAFGKHEKIVGEITSLKKREGTYLVSYDIWYSKKFADGKKDRGKLWNSNGLIKPTKENEKLMEQYVDFKKLEEEYCQKKKEILEKFETYSMKEIVENFGYEFEE